MRNGKQVLFVCVIFSLLLSACGIQVSLATKAPDTSRVSEVSPTIKAEVSDQSTPTPYVLQDWPMLPTATEYIPADLAKGDFFDPATGIRISYPTRWDIDSSDAQDFLATISSPDGALTLWVMDSSGSSGDLQTMTSDTFYSATEGLLDIKVSKEEPIILNNGEMGWNLIGFATLDNGVELEIGIVTAQVGGTVPQLFFYGLPETYDYYASSIASISKSLDVEEASLNGISRSEALVYSGGESTDPRDYDPATDNSSGDKLVFSGLVMFDRGLNLQPDLAESWEVSADGTVYTFHLRKNAVFHNGRPVTASDVIYSWDRAANPDTESDTVMTYLGDIVGVRERHEGTAEYISGLKAIDANTLQVTIDAPKPYFLLKLTYPTAFVVDKVNVESGEEWYRTPNGTGPYKLIRWDRFSLIIYERHDSFYLPPPAIRYVIIKLFAGESIRMYETGDIDVSYVSIYNLDRILEPDEPLNKDLISGVDLCTNYINFDVTQPPFDDVKVRQAFSMAFDRNKLLEVVYRGKVLPAYGLYPPALPGYNLDVQGLSYDPERARELLKESRYGGAEFLPSIVFTSSGYGSDIDAELAALAQMWQQNLGVTITVENLQPDIYYEEILAGHHGQLISNGWCADYPDPENFADVLFHTGADMNAGNYSNPQLDAFLEEARTEMDVNARIALYQQAEEILINDAAAIFISHSLSHVLVKPKVEGYVLVPVDISMERYMSIVDSE